MIKGLFVLKLEHYNNKIQTFMAQKTYFATTDYRNAKYQGAIKDASPDGLALLFDHQHLFAFSNFKKDVPFGPTLIVFPNRDYFYGKIKDKTLQSICVFAKANGQSYVFDFVNGQSNKIAYVDNNNIVIEFFYKDNKLKIGETKSYNQRGSSKWNIISDIFGKQIPNQFKNYKSYVYQNFIKQFQDVIQCSEVSGLTFLGFKNTPSLGIKFSKEDKVQQAGFFQMFPRSLEFGRKYSFDFISNKVQEGRFVQPEKIFTYQSKQQRPIEASRYTQEYFKRGTNFKNSFYKVSFFEEIFSYLKRLEKQVGNLEFVQFGQKILEGPQKIKSQEEVYHQSKKYSIHEVKIQILAAVKKKNLGAKRDSSPLLKSRQKFATSRQKIEPYNKIPINIQKYQHSPYDRSLSKQNRYVYSKNIAKQINNNLYYAQLSEKRQLRRQYSPKIDYYPNSQKKVLSEFRNVSPNKTYRYQDKYINNGYQRQKIRQQAIVEKSKRKISPLRQRASTAHIQSPYDRLQQVRIPQRQDNLAIREGEHFTLGKRTDQIQYNSYLKYKNRNKTPIKQSRFPYKPQITRTIQYQVSREQILQKKIILNGDYLQNKIQKQKETAKKEIALPARYKKQFKYF